MPVPEGEAEALRRCLSILASRAEPHERMNMAHRVEQRISGKDTSTLVYTFRHLAALFYPSNEEKAKRLEAALQAARAANELTSMMPADQGRITMSDLAIWPNCPPLPADSPLRYWLPGIPVEKAAPALPPQKLLPNSVMVEAIMKWKFETVWRTPLQLLKVQANPALRAEVEAERARLSAITYTQLSAEHEEMQRQMADKQRAEGEAREAALPFNQPAAIADFAYWAAMGHWTLDESVALLLGREPSKASWGTVYPYAKVSDFARQYERLRNLALRAHEMGYGQHAVEPVKVVAWATDVGHLVPLELATAVAARETKRLSREIAVLKGNLASQEQPAQAEAAAAPGDAADPKPADEDVTMNWGYVIEDLKSTPGRRAALLLEYMRSIEAKARDAVPRYLVIGDRQFEVCSDILQRLELLPDIDAALLDATNPRQETMGELAISHPAAPASSAADVGPTPVQRGVAQESTVLATIRALGHEPNRLPPRESGRRWVKADAWEAIGVCPLFPSEKVFDKAWERLRQSKEIAERRPG